MRCIISENICRAVLNRAGSFHMCHSDRKRYKDDEMKKKGICRLADPKELPGKISIRLLSDGKAVPDGFGKNHPRCAAVFLP